MRGRPEEGPRVQDLFHSGPFSLIFFLPRTPTPILAEPIQGLSRSSSSPCLSSDKANHKPAPVLVGPVLGRGWAWARLGVGV